jgi:hypothetical protein
MSHSALAARSARICLDWVAKWRAGLFYGTGDGEVLDVVVSGLEISDGDDGEGEEDSRRDTIDFDVWDRNGAKKVKKVRNEVMVSVCVRALGCLGRERGESVPEYEWVSVFFFSLRFFLSFSHFIISRTADFLFYSDVAECMKHHALGTDHRDAKFAARFLAFHPEKERLVRGVVEVRLFLPFHLLPSSFCFRSDSLTYERISASPFFWLSYRQSSPPSPSPSHLRLSIPPRTQTTQYPTRPWRRA